MENFLLLYSHCIIVNGASRAIICDLQRGSIYPIPLVFASLFKDERYIDIVKTMEELDDEGKEILKEYFDFLEEKELAFYCSQQELNCFPKMSNEWLFPAHISHCILDGQSSLSYFDEDFLKQLEILCCNFIQFRFFREADWDELHRILALINNSQIKSIEIIVPYKTTDTEFYKKVEDFVEQNGKISNLTITGAAKTHIYKEGMHGMGYILQTKTLVDSQSHCGIVDSSLFSINIPTFTESLHYNNCLNRKISIDINGNIKNCPSMSQTFGNVKNTNLEHALQHQDFKKYWDLSKDKIEICKDCEFRYICTDCRAYTERTHTKDGMDISKPLKCGYNPYTCQWEDWVTDAQKEKTIKYYEILNPLNGFV